MEYTEELKNECIQELIRICENDNLDICVPNFQLSNENRADQRRGDFDHDRNLVTVYCQSHTVISDLLHSVRHEARHAWQWLHYPDLCAWWEENIAFYNLVQNPQFFADHHWICIHETDAEQYASDGYSDIEPRLSIELSLFEQAAQRIFAEISPACAAGTASQDIRYSYCLLRLRGWPVQV